MKEKFLELVKQIKNTGIANILSDVTSAKELTAAWQKFKAENEKLFADCYAWADEYAKGGYKELFSADESLIDDPTEIVICIYIASRKDYEIHECNVFYDYDILTEALRGVGGNFNNVLADYIDCYYISEITAKELFSSDDEDGKSDDADQETGAEEGSEDGAEDVVEESDDADEETGAEENSEDSAEEDAVEEHDGADEETGNEEDSEDSAEDVAEESDADR